jgi:hypothetical protein
VSNVNLEEIFISRVATAIIAQAVNELESGDPELRQGAEEFLFGEDSTTDLLFWLDCTQCHSVERFRKGLKKWQERFEKKKAAAQLLGVSVRATRAEVLAAFGKVDDPAKLKEAVAARDFLLKFLPELNYERKKAA